MNKDEFICPIAPENMAKLATLFGEQVINSSTVLLNPLIFLGVSAIIQLIYTPFAAK